MRGWISLLVAACSGSEDGGGGLDAYKQACDLSSVASIEQQPGFVVDVVGGTLIQRSSGMDVTSLMLPIICPTWPKDDVVEVASHGYAWIETMPGTLAFRGREVSDGIQTRLVYEMRNIYNGQLYIAEMELLRKTRSKSRFMSMLAPGTTLRLEMSAEDIARATSTPYAPVAYVHAFR